MIPLKFVTDVHSQATSAHRSVAVPLPRYLFTVLCPSDVGERRPIFNSFVIYKFRSPDGDMARTVPDDSAPIGSHSSTSGRSRRRTDCMSLPYSSHPLYQLRGAIIVFAILGLILCILGSSSRPYYSPALNLSFTLLGASAFLCALDLLCYASRKKDNPDEEPNRPAGRWALVDLIMAILLQFAFWIAIIDLTEYIYYSPNVLGIYGILADLVCS